MASYYNDGMATYDGYRIEITELTGNLMAGDCTGLDVDESIRRYCELLRERVANEYPGAEIEINLEIASGVCPETRVYYPAGIEWTRNDEDLHVGRIGEIEGDLYESAEWYVELDTMED